MRPEKLSDDAITEALKERPGWERRGSFIACTFVFADFVEAFGWMTRVALVAEKLDHHPNWKNVYKTVEVELSTHDQGGVTELDLRLAAEMDRLAAT